MGLINKLYLLLLIVAFTIKAQVGVEIPNWVKPLNLVNASVNKNQIKEGYYYTLIDEQYNFIKKHSYFHYSLSAITEEALTQVSQIEFKFDPTYQKGILHKVLVHRNGNVTDRTSSVKMKVLNEENNRDKGVLNGRITYYANLSDIRKGDIIEYSYSIIGENPIMKNYFNIDLQLAYSVPVGKIHLRLITSKDEKINFVNRNTNIKPVVDNSDIKSYTWEIENPHVINLEGSTPSWYNPFPVIQISNLLSWNEVKVHCRSLFKLASFNKKELNFLIDSITQISENKEIQITSIIEFVQSHIRYSGNEGGIYSHVPRTPDIVLKNRYGDCKEKSVLLNALLAEIGIKAFPVLINSYLGQKIKEHVPAINSFDHCISVFYYNGEMVFIDPTISSQRGHFKLRVVPNYETGMVLDESNMNFTDIPINLASHCSILEEFIVQKSGAAILKVKSEYKGSDADEIRAYFSTNSLYDIQDSYKNFYSKFGNDIIVGDTVKYEDKQESNVFVTTESYLFPTFWVPEDSTKSKVITKDFMPYALHQRLYFDSELKRKDPLSLYYPLSQTQTITIEREGGWDVDYADKKEDNKLFYYRFITEVKGNKLQLKYAYASKTGVVMPNDYPKHKSGMDFIDKNMVFSAQENPIAEGVIGFNWPLLLVMLLGVVGAVMFILFMNKREELTVYETRYSSIGGWLILFGIGLTLNPLSLLIGTIREYYTEWGVNYYEFYFNEESSSFSPLKGYYSFLLPFFNIFFTCYSLFVVILFYQRKINFRINYFILKISHVVFMIINVVVIHSMYSGSSSGEERSILSSQTTATARSIFGALIWLPYIWNSERSKHTFTRSNINKPNEDLLISENDL